ncbi:MAG TPA: hypothetical protein VGM79_19905 [Streptosporangiaceae bacterium]
MLVLVLVLAVVAVVAVTFWWWGPSWRWPRRPCGRRWQLGRCS